MTFVITTFRKNGSSVFLFCRCRYNYSLTRIVRIHNIEKLQIVSIELKFKTENKCGIT